MQHHHIFIHLLIAILLAFSFSAASPIPLWRRWTQQILAEHPQHRLAAPQTNQTLYRPSSYLDIRPNAVVLAITTAEDELGRYFFLPVGKNVQTHSTPFLPRHPLTIHVVGAVDAEGYVVQPGDMRDIECAIYPAWNRTLNRGKSVEDFAIRVGSEDGVVDLSVAEQPFWLGNREAEAYECW